MYPLSCGKIFGRGGQERVHDLRSWDLFGAGSLGLCLHRRHLPRGNLRVGHRRVHEMPRRNVFEHGRGHVGDDLHELRERHLLPGRSFDLFRHLPRGNLRERVHAELRPLCRRDVFGGRHRDRVHELPGRNLLGRDGCHVREHLHELPRRDTLDRDRCDVVLRMRALNSDARDMQPA